MRHSLLYIALLFCAACKKEDEQPTRQQLRLAATCFECVVQWNTSSGGSGSFHHIGDTSFTTSITAGETYSIQACAPTVFTVTPPFDTLATVYATVGSGSTKSHTTLWVDSCASVSGNVQ